MCVAMEIVVIYKYCYGDHSSSRSHNVYIICSMEQCTSCTSCDPGSYQNATASDECLDCPPGNYSDKVGATKCPACANGYYSRSVLS